MFGHSVRVKVKPKSLTELAIFRGELLAVFFIVLEYYFDKKIMTGT